ncbi:MAG TPA: hypothetical protein VKG45_12610 [Actinomycetes bacterium]|nr:hypothetical protein [Actinomycetes bacterium]
MSEQGPGREPPSDQPTGDQGAVGPPDPESPPTDRFERVRPDDSASRRTQRFDPLPPPDPGSRPTDRFEQVRPDDPGSRPTEQFHQVPPDDPGSRPTERFAAGPPPDAGHAPTERFDQAPGGGTAPGPSPYAQPQYAQAPYDTPAPPYGQPPGRRPPGRAPRAAVAAGIVAAVVLLVAGGVLAGTMLTGGGDTSPTTVSPAAEQPATSPGQEPATSAPAAAAPAAGGPGARVVDLGFTRLRPDPGEDPEVSYAVVVANPRADQIATDVRVLVTFAGRGGRPLATEDDDLDVLLPGQTGAIAGKTEVTGAARMRAQVVVGGWRPAAGVTGRLTVGDVRTSAAAGTVTTTATLRSTFATNLEDARVVAIWRGPGGRILGGESTDADVVPAGGAVPVVIDSSSVPGRIARTDVYANLTDTTALGG